MVHLDFDSIANRMRYRARSGEFCGDNSAAEAKYVRKCSTRAGTTTLVLTRDFGNHEFGWLGDPQHARCWHLSIACDDPFERDAWLRAFFGDRIEHLLGHSCVTSYGEQRDIWHWRLFCDDKWLPITSTNPEDLLAAHMHRANDLGVAIALDLVAA